MRYSYATFAAMLMVVGTMSKLTESYEWAKYFTLVLLFLLADLYSLTLAPC